MLESIFKLTDQKWHKNIYNSIAIISLVFYILAFTGLLYTDPKYLETLHSIIKIYISIILIIRFNPFTKPVYNESNFDFDRKIAFSAGFFLLLASGINEYVEKLLKP